MAMVLPKHHNQQSTPDGIMVFWIKLYESQEDKKGLVFVMSPKAWN